MSQDEVLDIVDPGNAHLVSTVHCYACAKPALELQDMANFIIAFYAGCNTQGEPIIRDGVFNDTGKLAILKCCPYCGPKIKAVAAKFCRRTISALPHGPLRRMLDEIWPRRRPDWHLEIGWHILVPLMIAARDKKLAHHRANDREREAVERIKFKPRMS